MRLRCFLPMALSLLVIPAFPQKISRLISPETAVRAMLEKSAADWNRGDLDVFATSYKDSPDILFIGRSVRRGYAQMLAGYKAAYPTPEKMCSLKFSDLEVQPLDNAFVTATGRFHLERTPAGGGNQDGYFLLVVENTAAGWKIVRDDTTAIPPVSRNPLARSARIM